MGRALAESCGECRAIFEQAGPGLLKLMWEGPEAELNLTEHTQPAILTVSVAHALHLGGAAYLAGHSVGQYSSLVVAGSIDFDDALQLVRERGRLMQRTVPPGAGAMTAVLGLGD